MQRTPAFLCRGTQGKSYQIVHLAVKGGGGSSGGGGSGGGGSGGGEDDVAPMLWLSALGDEVCDDRSSLRSGCRHQKVELNNGSKQRRHLRKAVTFHRQEGSANQTPTQKNLKKITHIRRLNSIHEEVSRFPQNFSSIKTKGSIQPVLKLRAHCASRITNHDSRSDTPRLFLPFLGIPSVFSLFCRFLC
jgi:hypothetical protein